MSGLRVGSPLTNIVPTDGSSFVPPPTSSTTTTTTTTMRTADPVTAAVIRNGADGAPKLLLRLDQAQHLGQNHAIQGGRDYDLLDAKELFEVAQRSVQQVKAGIVNERQLDELASSLIDRVNNFAAANRGNMAPLLQVSAAHSAVLQLLEELKEARRALVENLKDGSAHANDPRAGLAEIRESLRVFRYELGTALGREMEHMEHFMRSVQHTFTFKAGGHLPEGAFARVDATEKQLAHAMARLETLLRVDDDDADDDAPAAPVVGADVDVDADDAPAAPAPSTLLPANWRLDDYADPVMDLSHRTNDSIRDFNDAEASMAGIRQSLGDLATKGGKRTVEFTCAVGALAGFGFSSTVAAGLRIDARVRVVAELSATPGGGPISATFRLGGGLGAKFLVQAGSTEGGWGVKGSANASAEVSHFTTRTYATVDDFILDAKRNRLVRAPSVGDAILQGICGLGRKIDSGGTTFLRWMGRRSDEVKLSQAEYLAMLQQQGVVSQLDRLQARRMNPMVVAERKGWTIRGQAGAGVSGKVGILSGSASVSGSREREVGVKSQVYVPFARLLPGATVQELTALLRPGPADGTLPSLPRAADANALVDGFDRFVDHVARNPPKGKEGWAICANRIRTYLIAAEMMVRNGSIGRHEGDRILARFSNPAVAIPPDIFREYLMDDAGAAKPPKLRKSFEAQVKVDLWQKDFADWGGGLVSDPIGAGALKGGAEAVRRQILLDQHFVYRYSTEKPADASRPDPRPWENLKKSTHELSFYASTPVRVILDYIAKKAVESAWGEEKSVTLKDEAAKSWSAGWRDFVETVLPELIGGGIDAYLADPAHVTEVLKFLDDHPSLSWDVLRMCLLDAQRHPEAPLEKIAERLNSTIGLANASGNQSLKTFHWTRVEGKIVSFSLSEDRSSKIGVNADPIAMPIGVAGDISFRVANSVNDYTVLPHPTLVTLLEKTENILLGDVAIDGPGNGEKLKNFLARNASGVSGLLVNLRLNASRNIVADALRKCSHVPELHDEVEAAYAAALSARNGASKAEKLEVMQRLLVALVMAFRVPLMSSPAAPAAAAAAHDAADSELSPSTTTTTTTTSAAVDGDDDDDDGGTPPTSPRLAPSDSPEIPEIPESDETAAPAPT